MTAYDRLHHRARCLVDGGASYLQPKPREGDDAHALTLEEADAFVLRSEGDFGANLCQMCDVGVIARILACGGLVASLGLDDLLHREAHLLARRKDDRCLGQHFALVE